MSTKYIIAVASLAFSSMGCVVSGPSLPERTSEAIDSGVSVEASSVDSGVSMVDSGITIEASVDSGNAANQDAGDDGALCAPPTTTLAIGTGSPIANVSGTACMPYPFQVDLSDAGVPNRPNFDGDGGADIACEPCTLDSGAPPSGSGHVCCAAQACVILSGDTTNVCPTGGSYQMLQCPVDSTGVRTSPQRANCQPRPIAPSSLGQFCCPVDADSGS